MVNQSVCCSHCRHRIFKNLIPFRGDKIARDWYDLLWYISENVSPNLVFLKNTLFQIGPWKGIEIELNEKFIKNELQQKIQSIEWNDVKFDVRKFLKPEKAETLELWSSEFFDKKLLKLKI